MNEVSEETRLKLFSLQKRCIECGSTYAMQIHHRIFRSEGEMFLNKFLLEQSVVYKDCYNKDLALWLLDDIQNLCVLCLECHEGINGKGVHGGNEILRQKLRNSFTEPLTGFSVNFYKINSLY